MMLLLLLLVYVLGGDPSPAGPHGHLPLRQVGPPLTLTRPPYA